MNIQGYESLASVMTRAYDQAAVGKGKERHATDAPFEQQTSQLICELLNTHTGQIHQAVKKSVESVRLPHDAAVRELLGAIVYLAGAVIALEAAQVSKPANDNGEWHGWCGGDNPAPGMMVEYALRLDPSQIVTNKSEIINWSPYPPDGNFGPYQVVKYRIIGPA
jgi:hypothetical protein